ncbi:MAG: lycopene cyclase domain-containing protein [Cytophagales bacterium]|nr:lycopene cyclase domain-containing protein [Cytophagales bacterium]
MYTYLVLNILTIIFPLVFSFEPQMKFYKKWSQLWPALGIVAALFIVWDHYFTLWGIWSFNPSYVLGIYIAGLPIEEWMFFITIPYACMFVYETVKFYKIKILSPTVSFYLTFTLMFSLMALAFIYKELMYTSVTFSLAAICLGMHWLLCKGKYLTDFYTTFFIQLIPFGIVNGVLTSWPVLIYNNDENLGIRLGTIPIEDAIYSLIILILNITLYELLYTRKSSKFEKSYA